MQRILVESPWKVNGKWSDGEYTSNGSTWIMAMASLLASISPRLAESNFTLLGAYCQPPQLGRNHKPTILARRIEVSSFHRSQTKEQIRHLLAVPRSPVVCSYKKK